MAKNASTLQLNTPKKRRPGVHSKKKNATNKNAKNYNKAYRGQGGKR